MGGKTIVKTVVVPDKLVNIVVNSLTSHYRLGLQDGAMRPSLGGSFDIPIKQRSERRQNSCIVLYSPRSSKGGMIVSAFMP